MLISEPRALRVDQIAAMVAIVNGNDPKPKELQTGVYERGDFGSSDFLRGEYNEYPNLGEHGPYGVCDGPENLLKVVTVLSDPKREFVAMLTPVTRDKSNAGLGGGWRWHKWGAYIGDKTPTTEYLDDEPEIDKVYCYHIYERASTTDAGVAG